MIKNIDNLKTPCYIINEEEYIKNIQELKKEFNNKWNNNVILGYSFKTNHFPYLINKAKELGLWAEVVSYEEYLHAQKLGFKSNEIIYNGPQFKSNLIQAVTSGSVINIDNNEELQKIIKNKKLILKNDYTLGIRVNFDLEALCPGETTVGKEVGRFGFCLENGEFSKAINLCKNNGITIKGIHLHTSTSSRSLNIYKNICNTAAKIISENNLSDIEYIDIGGGLFGGNFFKGKPSVAEYADTICTELKKNNISNSIKLILEPGAVILATAIDYLVSVVNIRNIRDKRVITVDGTSLHINPFMNKHETPFTMINGGNASSHEQIVGGSTCMELDRFYPRGLCTAINNNTKLLFHCAGAYTMIHNSYFINTPPCVYIHTHDEYSLCRDKKMEFYI